MSHQANRTALFNHSSYYLSICLCKSFHLARCKYPIPPFFHIWTHLSIFNWILFCSFFTWRSLNRRLSNVISLFWFRKQVIMGISYLIYSIFIFIFVGLVLSLCELISSCFSRLTVTCFTYDLYLFIPSFNPFLVRKKLIILYHVYNSRKSYLHSKSFVYSDP